MPVDLPPRTSGKLPEGLGLGMISGLMLAIPLWAAIGSGFIVFFLHRPFARSELLALAIAAIAQVLLMRYAWRRLGWRFGLSHAPAAVGAGAQAPVHRSTPARRMGLLAVLAVAYLHYYYWDVQTQIAMLPTVTVFVPVPHIG